MRQPARAGRRFPVPSPDNCTPSPPPTVRSPARPSL